MEGPTSFWFSDPYRLTPINPPFLRYSHLKICSWKSKVKVIVHMKGHMKGPTSYWLKSVSFHINLPLRFLRHCYLRIWYRKSKVKVMDEVKILGHAVGPTSYRLTSISFHVNLPFHSWDMAISNFDLENPGVIVQGSIVGPATSTPFVLCQIGQGHTSRFNNGSYILLTHIPFIPCQNSWDKAFLKFDIENPRSRSWVSTKIPHSESNILSTDISPSFVVIRWVVLNLSWVTS